jgi:hypothetical protein
MISKKDILDRISEEQIFEKYLRVKWKEKKKFKSPLREDTNPSCTFYTNRKGFKYFIDFGRGLTWDCFQLVKEVHHCDFYNALKIINQDFGLGLDTKYPKKTRPWSDSFLTPSYSSECPEYKLDFIPCEWSNFHILYWQQYGISKETCEAYHVVPISAILSSGKIIELNDEVAFAYTEGLPFVKIYRPFADKRSKWRNTYPKAHLFGLFQIRKGIELFDCTQVITKSLKDVMVLREMSISAVAVSSESVYPDSIDEDLQADYLEGATVLMDNDNAGKTCAAKWAEAGYKTIFIPEEYGAKDVSDLVLAVGFERAKEIVYQCLNLPIS